MGWRGLALVALAGCSRSTVLYEGEVSLAPVVVNGDVYFGTIDGHEHAIRSIRDGDDTSELRWRNQDSGAFGAGLATDRGTVVWATPTDDGLDIAAFRLVGYNRVELGRYGTLSTLDRLVGLVASGGNLYTTTRYTVASIPLDGGSPVVSCTVSPGRAIRAITVDGISAYALTAPRDAITGPIELLYCGGGEARWVATELGVSASTFAVRDGTAWLAGSDGLVRLDVARGTSERLLDEPTLSIYDVGDAVYAVLGQPGDTRLVDVADPWTTLATGMTGVRAVAVGAHRIYYVDEDGLVAVDR